LLLYDEDINIRIEAIYGYHVIGGRRAANMIGTLRNTEHKGLIDSLFEE